MLDRLQGRFLEDLADADHPCGSIDLVLCTHLHFSHIGWNTMLAEGRWVPIFPNARYLLGTDEFRQLQQLSAAEDAGANAWEQLARLTFKESVAPLIEANRIDLAGSDHALCAEVTLGARGAKPTGVENGSTL